jgi:hypothetical protein
LLEPITPDRTRATYSVYSDLGGLIPTFIANHFSLTAIGEIFACRPQTGKRTEIQRTTGNRIIARLCGQ